MLITSVKNPKIKRVCALRERRERDREGVTVLEGYRELSRSMDAGIRLTELYHCPELYLGEHEGELIARAEAQGAEIYETNADALVKMAYRDRPEGLIALAQMRHKGLDEMPVVPNGLYLVAETIEKPGNLGSMLRSADAVGATGMIICNHHDRQGYGGQGLHRADDRRSRSGDHQKGTSGLSAAQPRRSVRT